MVTLRVATRIAAAPERCFDLARSIDAHVQSAADTGERVVAGRASGLCQLGDTITWEGRHLGVLRQMEVRITAMDRPIHFQDRMAAGDFRRFEHDHHFEPDGVGGTLMRDELRFAAPYGPVGWLAERLVLAGHLRRFLHRRNATLRAMAEAG